MSIEIGTRFGKWETVGLEHGILRGKTKPRIRKFIPCRCECGYIQDIEKENLKNGKSGGCYKCVKSKKTKYGVNAYEYKDGTKKQTRMYRCFMNILTRCTNENYKDWDRYGGRGIECLWKDYGEFYSDMVDGYTDELTIDRIDNDGNYCKENCRWVDRHVQVANQSIRKANTSGYIGVHPRGDKFQCVLTYRNEIIQLGIFEDAREAAIVRDMEIINRNFPNTLSFKYEGITNVY